MKKIECLLLQNYCDNQIERGKQKYMDRPEQYEGWKQALLAVKDRLRAEYEEKENIDVDCD